MFALVSIVQIVAVRQWAQGGPAATPVVSQSRDPTERGELKVVGECLFMAVLSPSRPAQNELVLPSGQAN
jgi:hypothetical protein